MILNFIETTLNTLSHGPYPFLAYAIVLLIVFAESGLFIGFFLPGDSLLVAVGAFAALPNSPFNIWILLPTLFIAAVLGDNVGYWFGRRAGPAIFNRPESRLFKPHHLRSAHAFYEQHGGKTIILARFVPIVRTFAPIVAGAADMNYRSFFFYNLVGGFIWTWGITLIGYLFIDKIPGLKERMDLALIGIVFVSILPLVAHQISERRKKHTT